MQTRSFPSTPDGRSCRGRDPAADRRRDRRHDPLHRPARSGESGDRPRHRERVLACSLGRGQNVATRRHGGETTVLERGVSIDIPVGTAFQYRCTGVDPLQFLCITMPPWPGNQEATVIEAVATDCSRRLTTASPRVDRPLGYGSRRSNSPGVQPEQRVIQRVVEGLRRSAGGPFRLGSAPGRRAMSWIEMRMTSAMRTTKPVK